MTKYKLIKEYPNSPKLHTEIETDGNKILYKGVHSTLLIKEVTSYPEFWQEVIEKDYEILSYKHNDGQIAGMEYINACSKLATLHEGWRIYSVKRLSDGEIFTIGDICDDGKINEFYIENDKLYLYFFSRINQSRVIEYCKKAKKLLFTTEDGVDIYYDSYKLIPVYVVSSSYNIYPQFADKTTFGYKIFSTEEAAKECILMNKPCLSVNDLMKASSITYCNLTALKELVKSKL